LVFFFAMFHSKVWLFRKKKFRLVSSHIYEWFFCPSSIKLLSFQMNASKDQITLIILLYLCKYIQNIMKIANIRFYGATSRFLRWNWCPMCLLLLKHFYFPSDYFALNVFFCIFHINLGKYWNMINSGFLHLCLI